MKKIFFNRWVMGIGLFMVVNLFSCKQNDDSGSPLLTIDSIRPRGGVPGDTITIFGRGFPADPKEVIIKLGQQSEDGSKKAIDLPVLTSNNNQVKLVLPPQANESGLINITVGNVRISSKEIFFGGRIVLEGDITTTTTLSAINEQTGQPNRYLLVGRVKVVKNATLVIQPGTIIFGDKSSRGTLVIQRGGKIDASGTADQPIVFTSSQPAGSRAPGDWGGVILAGIGPPAFRSLEGVAGSYTLPIIPERVFYSASFRGTGDGDSDFWSADNLNNSGILRYVRIEYAGAALIPGQEMAGLNLYSIGENTTIEYVQVSYSGGDSFYWEGGNVNNRYLISYGGVDEDFETNEFFTGFVQYGLALRDPQLSSISQANGIETRNNQKYINIGFSSVSPNAGGIFSNITYIGAENLVRGFEQPEVSMPSGSNFGRGALLRDRAWGGIFNSVFIGANLAGISLKAKNITDPTQITAEYFTNPLQAMQLQANVILANYPANYPLRGGAFAAEAVFNGFTDFFFDPSNSSLRPAVAIASLEDKFYNTDGNQSIEVLPDSSPSSEKQRVQEILDFYGVAGLCNIANIKKPVLLISATSPLNQGASFEGKALSINLDKNIKFRGAFDANQNWAEKWANFDPQNTTY